MPGFKPVTSDKLLFTKSVQSVVGSVVVGRLSPIIAFKRGMLCPLKMVLCIYLLQ